MRTSDQGVLQFTVAFTLNGISRVMYPTLVPETDWFGERRMTLNTCVVARAL